MRRTVLLLLIGVACLLGLGVCSSFKGTTAAPSDPVMPDQYSMDWDIYTLEQEAPYDPSSHKYLQKGRGATYYNSAKQQMIEYYYDFCIPIFENPSTYHQFPCRFLNTNFISYLLVDTPMDSRPPCCVFATNFHPPHTNFISENHLELKGEYQIDGVPVDYYWWDIPLPGPFYYGFYRNTTSAGHRTPAGFAFPTMAPENWTQQIWKNFKEGPFDMSVFDVPESCTNAPPCVIFNDGDDSDDDDEPETKTTASQ